MFEISTDSRRMLAVLGSDVTQTSGSKGRWCEGRSAVSSSVRLLWKVPCSSWPGPPASSRAGKRCPSGCCQPQSLQSARVKWLWTRALKNGRTSARSVLLDQNSEDESNMKLTEQARVEESMQYLHAICFLSLTPPTPLFRKESYVEALGWNLVLSLYMRLSWTV